MKTLQQASERDEIIERLGRLRPDAAGQWGKLTCHRMVAHVADALRMAMGELPVPFKRTPLRFGPVKHMVIYWLPFPRNAPTAPELLHRELGGWDDEVRAVRDRIAAFPEGDPPGGWPVHPVFGRLSGRDWGALQYRHVDHHLRQFGA
jgi:hypothetical protein